MINLNFKIYTHLDSIMCTGKSVYPYLVKLWRALYVLHNKLQNYLLKYVAKVINIV